LPASGLLLDRSLPVASEEQQEEAAPERMPSAMPAGSMKIISTSVTEQLMIDSAKPHIRFRNKPIEPTMRSAAKTPLIAIIR